MPARAAVVGHPIGHSRSPDLHRAAYAVLGEAVDYGAHDLVEEQLPAFVDARRGDPAWRGLSVTMPLKSAAAACADELTELGEAVGVVNTLVFRPDGTVLGHNTDVAGIVDAVRSAGPVPAAPRAAVLGGGGTATAAVAAAGRLGAPAVDVFVRSAARAGRAVEAGRRLGVPVRLREWDEAPAALPGYDVVVSTLPPHGADELARDAARLSPVTTGVLLDAAYDPWPSAIARTWAQAGGAVAPGIDMLIFQAVDQIRLFTGRDPGTPLPREQDVIAALCTAVGRPVRGVPPLPAS
ncbi:shikimate dehydrogenase [Kocuria sediminis]|uniref:Shikimate dehydrogenase n=1 Tax=Kocuria sediminis TaxID=1038857 RepID=A0A6N8GIL4_9MICC|nr:shikimate dehydrogenase [Kocuria sediminis]